MVLLIYQRVVTRESLPNSMAEIIGNTKENIVSPVETVQPLDDSSSAIAYGDDAKPNPEAEGEIDPDDEERSMHASRPRDPPPPIGANN